MRRWIPPVLAAGLTAYVAVMIWMGTRLAAVPALGFDPLWGFLFSPVPLLRIAAVLQIAGSVMTVAGVGWMLLSRRTRSG